MLLKSEINRLLFQLLLELVFNLEKEPKLVNLFHDKIYRQENPNRLNKEMDLSMNYKVQLSDNKLILQPISYVWVVPSAKQRQIGEKKSFHS